ncbi:MAG: hypothetical protein MOGMAGMI_00389 [Candidatus Omnitrophica bacterium]|nr:hypothetical protein [Candidatus Omnitrophota bacterium]
MADITRLARLLNGAVRGVDLTTNSLVLGSLKLDTTELTKAILDKLILVQSVADVDGSFDTRYFTKTELQSNSGTTGSDLIGDDNTYSNFTPSAATLKGALSGIDTALATAGSNVFSDSVFRVQDNGDATKQLAFEVSAITTATTRTITIPDANLDLADIATNTTKIDDLVILSGVAAYSEDLGTFTGTTIADASTIKQALQALETSVELKANDADVIKKDGTVTFTAVQSMGGFKLTNLATPTADTDAATKEYVDAVAEGLKPKQAVRAATVAAGTLASDFEDGDVIDGVTLATGDRILIKNQAAPTQNGIYLVQATGAPVRAEDFDSLSPIDEINGAYVAVQEGTDNAGKLFIQVGSVTTIGTDPIQFTFFNSISGLTGGDGITVSGSNISVDHDGEGLQFVANQLALELDGSTLTKAAAGLKIADAGVGTTQLANDSVDKDKINADVAGLGLGQNVDGSLEVNVDDSTIEINTDALRIKDGAITNAKVDAAAAIELSKLAALTSDRVAITNGSGVLAAATATSTQLSTLVSDGSADALHFHSSLKIEEAAGETFAANTSFLVRYAVDGETAGRVYKADNDATTDDLFHVIGIAHSASGVTAGQTIRVVTEGLYTLGSSDAAFNAADIGKPVYLGSTGAFTITPPTTNNLAVKQIGVVRTTTTIFIQILTAYVN